MITSIRQAAAAKALQAAEAAEAAHAAAAEAFEQPPLTEVESGDPGEMQELEHEFA